MLWKHKQQKLSFFHLLTNILAFHEKKQGTLPIFYFRHGTKCGVSCDIQPSKVEPVIQQFCCTKGSFLDPPNLKILKRPNFCDKNQWIIVKTFPPEKLDIRIIG